MTSTDMRQELAKAFKAYTSAVQSILHESGRSKLKDRLVHGGDDNVVLGLAVGDLESGDQFRQLVKQTRLSFPPGHAIRIHNQVWHNAVKNFFRRSGYYISSFENDTPGIDVAFDSFCHAFERKDVCVRHFALMEYVTFAEDLMDFGSFQVRRFGSHELRDVFQNKVNEVFYPWAVIDAKQLQSYWFICLADSRTEPEFMSLDFKTDWTAIDRVSLRYSTYAPALEAILQQLVLFEWERDWWGETPHRDQHVREKGLDRGWDGFYIPFVLTVDDELLDPPRMAPKVAGLATESIYNPETGEYEMEIPQILIYLDGQKTKWFEGHVKRMGDLLDKVRGRANDWNFLNGALGNLVKAFFTPDNMEQLLWHIVVLEALLSEKGSGVTRRMAQRLGSILAGSENERKGVRKDFAELYSFRSDLVHGRNLERDVYVGHLRTARELARGAAVWFVHCLGHIERCLEPGFSEEEVPRREDILTALDLDAADRARLRDMFRNLPVGFPQVEGWVQ